MLFVIAYLFSLLFPLQLTIMMGLVRETDITCDIILSHPLMYLPCYFHISLLKVKILKKRDTLPHRE